MPVVNDSVPDSVYLGGLVVFVVVLAIAFIWSTFFKRRE